MHPDTAIMQNPGSPEYAAGAAALGRIVGGLPGLALAYAQTDKDAEKPPAAGIVVRFAGQIAGAAGGAALGAPDGLKGRAAVGAALGGAVPFVGAPLAALGAYIATRPSARRQNNPMSRPVTVAVVGLGLLTAGGLIYAGLKALEARKSGGTENGEGDGEAEGNIDDWGWDLDRYELWGLGPVTGADGKEYFYRIYNDLGSGKFEIAYTGDGGSGTMGPFDTSADAEWCAENRLPLPCVNPGG